MGRNRWHFESSLFTTTRLSYLPNCIADPSSRAINMGDKLDIDAINRTRVSLGMQPLPTNNNSGLNFKSLDSSKKEEPDLSTLESREALASDNWQKLQDEANSKKRKEAKRAQLKKERDAAQRFAKIEGKGLGEAEDVDAKSWVLGGNKRQKKIAKERARQLEKELAERENQAQYTEKDLAGARVGHELGAFDEGDEQVLTLRDTAVDAESDEDDELENVNIRETEKLKERLELKKRKPVYDPNAIEESGQKSLLGQYDEEIDGKKKKRFTLDGMGMPTTTKKDIDGNQVDAGPRGIKISLDALQDDKPISDYRDVAEVKMRKLKKKKEKSKKRQRLDDDEDDISFPQTEAAGVEATDAMEVDDITIINQSRKRALEEFIDDEDLQSSLAAQRMAALKKRKKARPEDIARQLRDEQSSTPKPADTIPDDGGIVIDETSEFVANLQKPKTIEDNPDETTTTQEAAPTSPQSDAEGDVTMSYNNLEDKEDTQVQLKRSTSPINNITTTGLEVEGTLNTGIGSTLGMLTQRGLLKTAASGDLNAQHRERQRFLGEKQQREAAAERAARTQRERDRASGRFDRMSAKERERYAQDENRNRDQVESRQMAEVFNREYKPSVDLKYVDEFGRSMNQREAFKHLSHQFHGKGSGKLKTEKMLKKIEDEKKREAGHVLDSSQASGMNGAVKEAGRKNRQAGVRLQ